MLRSLTLCVLVSSSLSSTHAIRYHVNNTAAGSANGLTWENAFTNLQEALSIVIPGDEIWVAAGQYKPTTSTTRTISFQLRNGVDLYGGFAGNETDLSQRVVANNPTVLNGDIGEPGNSSDNSHTVVTANNITTTVVLDGFRIVNGYSAQGSTYNGGGLRITNTLSGELILRNCAVINNFSGTYGGGLYLASARLTVEDCEFNNNQAGSGTGGAVYNGNVNGSGSMLTIRDCRFLNNSARVGACISNSQSYNTVVMDRCIFTNNDSENSIINLDGFENAEIRNSYVIGNTVDGFSSNVLEVNTTSSDELFSMINCTVAHNFNVYSGNVQTPMLRFLDTQHVIKNSIIHGNTMVDDLQVSTNADIFNSIVEGGHTGGTNIIDADPLFTGPYTGVQTAFNALEHDYTLQPTSPAVNAGLNEVVVAPYDLDLALLPRIQGGVVDLGCYETDQIVGLDQVRKPSKEWYYDVTRSELHVMRPSSSGNLPLVIHDMDGRLVMTFTAAATVLPIDLPSGAYLASSPELGAMRFVVR